MEDTEKNQPQQGQGTSFSLFKEETTNAKLVQALMQTTI